MSKKSSKKDSSKKGHKFPAVEAALNSGTGHFKAAHKEMDSLSAAPAIEAKLKKAKKEKPEKEKKTSAIDAAARVLDEEGKPMGCKEMIEAMAAKGYWTSPGGKTPHATLYSAILREISAKGKEARFKKTDRGHFAFLG